MAQPDGYEQGGAEVVWLLLKAIYGLKHAGREWKFNIHLGAFILSLGLIRFVSDPCVYVKRSRFGSGNLLVVSVYVDYIPSAFQ